MAMSPTNQFGKVFRRRVKAILHAERGACSLLIKSIFVSKVDAAFLGAYSAPLVFTVEVGETVVLGKAQ